MLTTLLDKTTAPLNRLALSRIQLDASSPTEHIETAGRETLVYSLCGRVTALVNGQRLGVLGGRRSVIEPYIDVLRLPSPTRCTLDLLVDGHAADLLLVTCTPRDNPREQTVSYVQPVVHRNDAIWHDVGSGCYRRAVAEVPTPEGFELHCGQTNSDGMEGVWSSFPSHCAPEEMGRYAEHEECFVCYTPTYFLMREDGRYCTGDPAKGVREIQNGQALVTPLGSHELVSLPSGPSVYVWAYLSFLKKSYNKFADQHIAKVYVK